MSDTLDGIKYYILVHIDDIMDTRLCCINDSGEGVLDRVINDGYVMRTYDRHDSFDYEEYLKRYEKRGARVLSDSTMTSVPSLMSEMLIGNYKEVIGFGKSGLLGVMLNFHPYGNMGEKHKEELCSLLARTLEVKVDIEPVDYSKDELTPRKLQQLGIRFFINYTGEEWTSYHIEKGSFEETLIPEVTLLLPKLITAESNNIDELLKDDPFKMIATEMKQIINMSFVSSMYFSSIFLGIPEYMMTRASVVMKDQSSPKASDINSS